MQHRILPALALVAIFGLATGHAAPVSYTLPDETAAFKPGANLETVQNNCTTCHSADYTRRKIQEGVLGCRSDQDDQGLRRADRRCGRRKNRRLSDRELLKIASPAISRTCLREPAGPDYPVDKIGTVRGFAASNARKTGKKAEIRCDMAYFCRNPDSVCATQSAPTRVS